MKKASLHSVTPYALSHRAECNNKEKPQSRNVATNGSEPLFG